jgi:hypothetical protein
MVTAHGSHVKETITEKCGGKISLKMSDFKL